MHLRILLILGMAVSFLGSANANYSNSCYSCDSCCDGWSAHIDWLYWKTRKCGLDYAWPYDEENTRLIGEGKAFSVKPDYDHGFRIGIFKGCNEWDYGARYTYYSTDKRSSADDDDTLLAPSRIHPDDWHDLGKKVILAVSKFDLDMHVIDLEMGHAWEMNCDANVRLFGGVKIAFIDQDLDTEYENEIDNAEVKERVDMDAYGLYVGGMGHWNICNGFGVFGRVSAATLLGDFERSFHETGSGGDDNVDVKDECYGHVNHIEFASGIDYQFCDFGCGEWSLRIGYEFHTWCNVQDFIHFVDDVVPANTVRSTTSLGFDGIFVRLNVNF